MAVSIITLKTGDRVITDLKEAFDGEGEDRKGICLIMDEPYILNLAGDLNVGMIMRTACIMGAERLIIFGRRRYDKRSTVGAQNYIPVARIAGLNDDLTFDVEAFDATMLRWNYQPVFIETGGNSIDATDWKSISPKPCLVFGNEGQGIPDYIMRDYMRVSIDQRGVLRSLNVAVAAGIACHEVSKCLS